MDNHATTQVDQRVIEAMLPFFSDKFGNIASAHCFGREVRNPCQQARQQVADLINAAPEEIVFTSGATESDNLAIKGIAETYKTKGRHIVTCVTEHKAVLDSCAYLATQGFAVTYLPVDKHGCLTASAVAAAIRRGAEGTTDRTILVTLMGANNEIGTIHPFNEIGIVCRSAGVVFHIDGAQCVGKIPFDVRLANADLVSISAHKIYGPKGIGALYVRQGEPKLKLSPQMHGGGQENGLRAGTLAVALIVGLGKACAVCKEDMGEENDRLLGLRGRLETTLLTKLDACKINGHAERRLPGNSNISFLGVDGELLMLALKDIALSSTSACSAKSPKPSHVLTAIGLADDTAFASLRFGIGRFNTAEEVDFAVEKVAATVLKLRASARSRLEKRAAN